MPSTVFTLRRVRTASTAKEQITKINLKSAGPAVMSCACKTNFYIFENQNIEYTFACFKGVT